MLIAFDNMDILHNRIRTEVQQLFKIFTENKIPVIMIQRKSNIKIKNLLRSGEPEKYFIEPYQKEEQVMFVYANILPFIKFNHESVDMEEDAIL